MNEKFKTFTLAQLREMAKAQGVKSVTTKKKDELAAILSELDALPTTDKDSANERSAAKTPMDKTPADKTPMDAASLTTTDHHDPAAASDRPSYAARYESHEDVSEHTHFSSYDRTARNNNRPAPDLENNSFENNPVARGILEVIPEGFGFIRSDNFLSGSEDVYVSHTQIRRFNMRTGDIVEGYIRLNNQNNQSNALLYVKSINGLPPIEATKRGRFDDLTPIFPNERIRLETDRRGIPMRIMDIVSPIGKGQRGMIVSPPKTGKTTLLKQIASAITKNYPDMNLVILLIDERPEEVTDIKESITGDNVEVIYSTFDELPEHHKRVSEMVLEHAKRLVEHKKDVCILLDSITRLARAYNLTCAPSGRTLSGGLDPAALYMPKKFFGAARNMREGGSLTVLATALVDTGSRLDDMVFEEFKGTGNMELVLDRSLSEKRIFPALDILKSGTRREDLLLSKDEMDAAYIMRRALSGAKADESLEHILQMLMHTENNAEFIHQVKITRVF